MGFYSEVEFGINAKDPAKFNKFLETIRQVGFRENSKSLAVFVEGLRVADDGHFLYTDGECTRQFNDTDDIVQLLAERVTRGYLQFTGEGNQRWGYLFDGCGKVSEMVFKTEPGKEIPCYPWAVLNKYLAYSDKELDEIVDFFRLSEKPDDYKSLLQVLRKDPIFSIIVAQDINSYGILLGQAKKLKLYNLVSQDDLKILYGYSWNQIKEGIQMVMVSKNK